MKKKSNQYDNLFMEAGIRKGDILDIVSDMSSLFFYYKKQGIVFDMNEFFDALENSVGEDGTILVRVFNWDYCHDGVYDIKHTRGQVGELGNFCLNRKGYRRTQHPIYSWMVWGKYQQKLCEMENIQSFGHGSPWDFFEKAGSKMLVLGNTKFFGLTCLHHIEQELQMDYRYEKPFTSIYIDENGLSSEKTYSMYVRRLDRQVIFNEDVAREELLQRGAMHEMVIDGYLNVAMLDYEKVYSIIRSDLKKGIAQNWVLIKPMGN